MNSTQLIDNMLLEYPPSPVRTECTCCASCTKAKSYNAFKTSQLPKGIESYSLKRSYDRTQDTSILPRVSKTKIFKPNIAPDFTFVGNNSCIQGGTVGHNQMALAFYTQDEQKRVMADNLLKGYQALEKSCDMLAENNNKNKTKNIKFRSSPPPLSCDPVIEKYSTRYFVDRNRIEKIEDPAWTPWTYKKLRSTPSPTASIDSNRNSLSPFHNSNSCNNNRQDNGTTKDLISSTAFSLSNNPNELNVKSADSSFVYPQIERVLSISPRGMGSSGPLPLTASKTSPSMGSSVNNVKRLRLNTCKSNSLDSMSSFSGSDEEETTATTTTTVPSSIALNDRKTHKTRVERAKYERTIKLYKFLIDLLEEKHVCVMWIDRNTGIFKITDSEQLAQLWGQVKLNASMTYEKLARSFRHYYKKGILDSGETVISPVSKCGKRKLYYKFSATTLKRFLGI